MNKRKLIRKLAIPAAIVASVSLIVLIALIPIKNSEFSTHKDEFKSYMNSFMEQNKKYLKEIAGKIKTAQPDLVLINELQAEYLMDHQRTDQPKKYLWMSSVNGDFIFGVPPANFQKANKVYDKYTDMFKTDGFYRDRNDFMTRLIDKIDQIDFTQFDRYEQPMPYPGGWHFPEEDGSWEVMQSVTTTFTTPVYDANNKLIGELYMKVDDHVNIQKYYSEHRFEPSPYLFTLQILSIIFLCVSGAFLWFLLPTWVYIDAEERDVKTPGIWAFLALTSLFFGLTIYLITRPSTLKSFNCPKCDGELNGTRAYCPHCGYDLSNTFCQQCQYPIKPEWQFCPNCRSETGKHEKHNSSTDLIVP